MIAYEEMNSIKVLVLGIFFGVYFTRKLSKKPKAFMITGFKKRK
jgi:hypothetical protein